jgi:hypothetical protein
MKSDKEKEFLIEKNKSPWATLYIPELIQKPLLFPFSNFLLVGVGYFLLGLYKYKIRTK